MKNGAFGGALGESVLQEHRAQLRYDDGGA
jgi:hypothetical protein